MYFHLGKKKNKNEVENHFLDSHFTLRNQKADSLGHVVRSPEFKFWFRH